MPRPPATTSKSKLQRRGGQSAVWLADLPAGGRKLLTGLYVGQLSYLGADGYPRVSPVWFDLRDGQILISTHLGSYKAKSLRCQPRAALGVSNGTWPYRSLALIGEASIEPLPERGRISLVRREARRFLGRAAGDVYIAEWLAGGRPGPGELVRITIRTFRFYE